MSKKVINQNTNYDNELLDSIETNFIFDEKPINRLKNIKKNSQKVKNNQKLDKENELTKLKSQISSIEDCNIKNDSKKIILGDGNIDSPIMLVGEAPGINEEKTGQTFMGEVGDLLKKMLIAINIKKKIYTLHMS